MPAWLDRLVARLARLRRDARGGAMILFAFSLTALGGAAAAAIDIGSLFLAKRQLQGVADAAALAAVQGDIAGQGRASAQSIIDRSGIGGIQIDMVTPGQYARDKAVAMDARFAPGTTAPSAARVTMYRHVPLYFGKLLLGKTTFVVRARATAAQVNMAAFSIGSKLAGLSGGLANDLLSSIAGTNLNLSVVDTQGLASADVDLLGFADALRVRLNMQGATYGELFGANIPLNTLVAALADASPGGSGTALANVAARLGAGSVRLSDMIDLGPLGQTSSRGEGAIRVNALSFLRSLLIQSKGGSYDATLEVAVPGLTSVKLIMAGGGVAHSPWLTVTQAKDVVVRTAASRIYLETKVATVLAGIASLRVPLYVELAAAEARLSDIRCDGSSSDGVKLAVTPSAGSLAVADIQPEDIGNFSMPMAKRPAVLVNLLGTKVNASAELLLGGTQTRDVLFTRDDIANHRTKTVTTQDLAAGAATSLVNNVQLSVTTLGLTLNAGPLVSGLGGVLLGVAPLLDGLLNQVTGLLGVRIGAADVQVDRMKCGVPMLVA